MFRQVIRLPVTKTALRRAFNSRAFGTAPQKQLSSSQLKRQLANIKERQNVSIIRYTLGVYKTLNL